MGSAVTCNLEKMELTDQEWLELNRQSLEGWGRLAIARFRREPDGVIADIAGEVLVHHRGRFIAAKDLAAQIVRGVQNNLIFESWNYECASAIDSAAWGLTPFDGEALRIASGYHNENLGELYEAAQEAISEARMALYGHA